MKDLPANVRARVRFKGEDVVDLTDVLTELEALEEPDDELVVDDDSLELTDGVDVVVAPVEPTVPAARAELTCDLPKLAAELFHADPSWLRELLVSLNERRQVVLEGHPGRARPSSSNACSRRAAWSKASPRSCSSTRPTPTRTSSRVSVPVRTMPAPRWPSYRDR